ncbi:hypothetical protein Y1Q_0011759 [Alligator mississippiensis]|uniref:Uncharacterized protein n=1 Tax=Alligator mississippiensis TaxID=8496 RepID=A0A151M143_ALLMI|nr:hypothetical protein Y1Q_0011759 [Alligator mississippiensis]
MPLGSWSLAAYFNALRNTASSKHKGTDLNFSIWDWKESKRYRSETRYGDTGLVLPGEKCLTRCSSAWLSQAHTFPK